MSMKCPRDENELETKRYEGDVLVERCPVCNGVWLDRGELEAVQNVLEHDYLDEIREEFKDIKSARDAYQLVGEKQRPEIKCPNCQNSLHREEYAFCSLILIDRCAECGGIWLDNGELQKLEQFYERETDVHRFHRGFFASLLDPIR